MLNKLRISSVTRNAVRFQSTASLRDIESEIHNDNNQASLSKAKPKAKEIPFSRAEIGNFYQSPPVLGNQFMEDVTLRTALKRILPSNVLKDITPDLERFGARVAGEIRELGEACEQEPPRLEQYHAWGRRVDRLVTSPAWRAQKIVSAEEGLIATAYDRQHGPWSRLHQVAKMYLYSPSSGLYSCPLAMTDGAAKIITCLKDDRLQHAYNHLTSADPTKFWTSGQWMTERRGGSDVADGTETVAVPQEDGTYRLYGYKWFSSATDSDITFTLARVVNEAGETIQGTKGLSMFYLETRDANGMLNGIQPQRLKDKLGTRQLPSAELLLDGAKALMVSTEGRGVGAISNMLTITRIHNSISSAASMRRIINLARDYSHSRVAFGSLLKDHTLHVKHLANMEIEQRAALLLTVDLGRLLGHEEVGLATPEDIDLLRLLTPVSKLYTAKQAVAVASEGLECFGGMGYLEDTGLPSILRDAQVLPIWEGTTNILSLDVIRSIAKSRGGVLKAFHVAISKRCANAASHQQLGDSAGRVKAAADGILQFAATERPEVIQVAAREFANSLGQIYMGSLLLEHAVWEKATPQDVLAAKRWCERDLVPVLTNNKAGNYTQETTDTERHLVFDGYTKSRI